MSNSKKNSMHLVKQSVGHIAAQLVEEGMVVGLGTGSTAASFVASLIERCKAGLKITAVATSEKTKQQALAGGIPVVDMKGITSVDLTVDGADEIDSKKRMIKGGGGALLREKIIASCSREMVVVVDETKLVKQLGAFPLPVVVVPFGFEATQTKIERLGNPTRLRKTAQNYPFLTDDGHYIIDIHPLKHWSNPEAEEQKLLQIPGVVDTGFFFHLAGRIIIGYTDGKVEIRA